MKRTFHPESDISFTRYDTASGVFVYTLKNGRTVTIPATAFANVTPGVLGRPQRRAILAQAVREAMR